MLARTALFYTALAYIGAHALPNNGTEGQEIQWGPCTLNASIPVDCGNVTVPLDYSTPNSTATLDIELLRVRATNQPSKGSILFNPGGPGGGGQSGLIKRAELLLEYTGGSHDLISFDPRGVGKTMQFLCYKTAAEIESVDLRYPRESGNASDTTLGELWANMGVRAGICKDRGGDIGELLGTAFVARDLMRIVDALGEDGMLRYWGISYGTVLGATAAAMFPDRMDRVIIDGVTNIHQYWHDSEIDMFAAVDESFSSFLASCVEAGPDKCPLARNNISASDLEAKLYAFIEDDLKYNPFATWNGRLITYDKTRYFIFNYLYDPAKFPDLAALLDGILTRNPNVLDGMSADDSTPEALNVDARDAIWCADKTIRANSLEEMRPTIEDRLYPTSRAVGDTWAFFALTCPQWRMEAKERYLGDYNVRTRHPMLVIGNTFDPVTPLVSARNASETFEGSVLLHYNSHGHGSLKQPSRCQKKAVQAYFADGTLPEPGTICEPDAPLKDVFQ
ncbi:Carboxylesterase B [Lasiodiplodia hormozganensis]|uniref:Carboxylesterase B n=1 Tax=Lasiodiplodia hormozganensis TaxID=869390 RepID=A0AA40D6D6_9PEZI|nr:Carboxylesterase B [Lasiodiplodia hormozganensis]